MDPKLVVLGPFVITFLVLPYCTAGGAVFFLPIRPVEIAQFSVHTYGVLLALAFLSGIAVAMRRAGRQGIEPAKILDLGFWILVCAIVGGKLALVLVDFRRYWADPRELIGTLRSAGVFYGGLAAATAGSIAYLKRHGLSILKVADICAPAIGLGEAIGRLGCFSAGCCYGKPTHFLTAVTFTDEYSHMTTGVPLHIPIHPTQLYLSATGLFLFLFLTGLSRRKRFDGEIFFAYILGYGILRFGIEFLRGDDRGPMFWGVISISQLLSIIGIVTSFALLLYFGRKRSRIQAEGGSPPDAAK
jgi:phosphatidylglycerol:prolipoprotein diacylglycerol transferase